MRNSLNVVGAGRLGRTLAKLFHDHHLLTIQAVLNQSLGSAQEACDFIGAGFPLASLEDLPPADLTLIAVPDNQIEGVCQVWAQSPGARAGSIVFHASGALGSRLLHSAQDRGIHTASIHPLKSFASPEQATQSFNGTFCAVEGEAQALAVLCPLFEALGADLALISPESKQLYHAACVMACGGLTALYASAQDLLIKAGVPAEKARALLGPYMKQTLDNNTVLGPKQALTGPVARGDQETVQAHEQALKNQGEGVGALYRVLTALQSSLK